MAREFLPVDRNQQFLLPPNMAEWLPADHLALFIIDLVETLDLTSFEAAYQLGGVGRRAYAPKMLLALLLYAYAEGLDSSREIEQACRESVACRVICAGVVPDHSAIARFRAMHESRIKAVFAQILAMCASLGMVRLGVVAIDGTKISANAARYANRTRKGLEAEIEAEVQAILDRHRANDEADDERFGDARGDELPPELADPKGRLARLREAQRRLDEVEATLTHPGVTPRGPTPPIPTAR